MSPPNKKTTQRNKSLIDGLECILELCAMERPVGSREMGRELGIEHTRVNRFLSTLESIGLAIQTSDRKYIPGPGLHVLSAMSMRGSHLLDGALPIVRKLGAETGLRVALGVRWRTNVCYLYHGHTEEQIAPGIASHNLYPVEQSSIGVMLLTELTSEQIQELYAAPGAGVMTAPDMDELLRHVESARQLGYAISSNLRSIAVLVGQRPIAGLALARDVDEGQALTPAEVKQCLPSLQRAAETITRTLARRV